MQQQCITKVKNLDKFMVAEMVYTSLVSYMLVNNEIIFIISICLISL